ncbi:unnamed protein product [Medioppia subpectinata]|uniref:Transcription initiation factor TFIID subunit 12 n=1 Tax=Medioppia subpectinata TaxID=1979941 RepID=A0A7R9KZP7_9ACAR|nr:unnamed protein product [Medioppia subpectinata]CAG2112900.1 unnamed protein product [Medioppia subpectinata]
MSQTISQTLSTTAPLMSAQLIAGPTQVTINNGSVSSAVPNLLSQTLANQSAPQMTLQTQTSSTAATPQPTSQPSVTSADTEANTTAQTIATALSQESANSAITTSSSASAAIKNPVVILDKTRLQELVQEVDPNEQLEDDVEDMLLTIADEFIESLVYTSTLFAKHRKSTTLDVRDVQLALEKNWKMWVPGFGTTDDTNRQHKKSFTTEAHKQRMALIKKTIKKF